MPVIVQGPAFSLGYRVGIRRNLLGTSTLLLFIGLVLTSCTPSTGGKDQPLEVATAFVETYDQWAQDGYSADVPEGLKKLASDEALDGLESDGRWYSNGRVRQRGSIQIVDAQLAEATEKRAVVAITLDSSDVEVIAAGQPTWRSDQKTQRMEVILEHLNTWRVSELTSVSKDSETK